MEPNFRFLALDNDDPTFSWRGARRSIATCRGIKTMTEILSPLDPDLRPYKKHGGKLLMYHGWSDPGDQRATARWTTTSR